MYTYIGVDTHTCLSVRVHTCAEARDRCWVFSSVVLCVIFWVRVSLNLALMNSARLAGQLAPGFLLFPSSQRCTYRMCRLKGSWGYEPRSSCFTVLAISLASKESCLVPQVQIRKGGLRNPAPDNYLHDNALSRVT